MRSRFAVCMMGAWSLLVSASMTAQAQPAPPPGMYAPGAYDGPAESVAAYDYPNPRHTYGRQQYGAGPDRLITERLPDDNGGFYEDTPVDRFLTAVVKSTWLRVEYMNFTFDKPGSTLLGSRVAGIVDPSKPFRTTVADQPATARVPTTEALHFRNVQGLRGTIGLPTSIGSFEASFLGFERAHSEQIQVVPPPGDLTGASPVLNPAAQIQIATSTLTNGQVGTNLFLYDKSFQIFQNSQLFGGEANWIGKSPYETGLVVSPLAGFRYFDFRERLFQRGTFNQLGQLDPALVSDINSDVNNRVYAPQIGMRFEFVQPWLTLGVAPKVAMGVNTYDADVSTNHLRSPGDPAVSTSKSGTRFTTVGDLSVYARINVRENFSLNVGYQLFVAGGMSRPANNIRYNDNGPSQPAAIVVDPSFRNMVWQGLTVGGEFRFR